MIRRVTVWEYPQRGACQVAVAMLQDDWEVCVEVVEPVGPFDELAAAVQLATDGCARLSGLVWDQLSLF